MSHGSSGTFADEVALHLSNTSHDGEKEATHGSGGVDGLSAKVNEVEIHLEVIPALGDSETVGSISEEPIELVGDDRFDLGSCSQFKEPLASISLLQWLASRDARVTDLFDQLHLFEASIGSDGGSLSIEADAFGSLLSGGDADVGDGLEHGKCSLDVVEEGA